MKKTLSTKVINTVEKVIYWGFFAGGTVIIVLATACFIAWAMVEAFMILTRW